MKKSIATLCSLLLVLGVFAQDSTSLAPDGAANTGLRADGKIYVVVAVLVTILLGLFLYIFRLDRKITRLEKQP